MVDTNIHDPLHVYSNRELPLTQLPVDSTIDTLHPFLSLETNRLQEKVNKALNSEKYICMKTVLLVLDYLNKTVQ